MSRRAELADAEAALDEARIELAAKDEECRRLRSELADVRESREDAWRALSVALGLPWQEPAH